MVRNNRNSFLYLLETRTTNVQDDIFSMTLAGLMFLSARLFVNGTSLLKANVSTAPFSLIRHSTRFFPFVRFYLPFLSFVFTGGGSAFSPNIIKSKFLQLKLYNENGSNY